MCDPIPDDLVSDSKPTSSELKKRIAGWWASLSDEPEYTSTPMGSAWLVLLWLSALALFITDTVETAQGAGPTGGNMPVFVAGSLLAIGFGIVLATRARLDTLLYALFALMLMSEGLARWFP